jgi:putative phage-type endonuclease
MSEQRTAEWFAERLGCLTASRFADAVAKTKTGSWGASRAGYAAELKIERITRQPYPHYVSTAMQWGTDKEPEARVAYCQENDCDVVEVGFVPHPHIAMTGCSPDGLIGTDGMIEIKCPDSATHWDMLETDKIPAKYITQMMWQMACTGRVWCDFASFDPRMPLELQLYVRRIDHDEKLIEIMERQAVEFLAEVDESVRLVLDKFRVRIAA